MPSRGGQTAEGVTPKEKLRCSLSLAQRSPLHVPFAVKHSTAIPHNDPAIVRTPATTAPVSATLRRGSGRKLIAPVIAGFGHRTHAPMAMGCFGFRRGGSAPAHTGSPISSRMVQFPTVALSAIHVTTPRVSAQAISSLERTPKTCET
jgi:hypothetical protein